VSSTNEPDPLLGTVVDGKYRLLSHLGAGGMGKVYRAEQIALGRAVAVKVLDASPNHREADPAVERRFFLEASLSAKLAHPNVVTVHDYGRVETEFGPQFYLVMELLEGETLHRRLQRGPTPMPASEAVAIAIEIARGLRAAHKAGLVHRDLKPGNVMLHGGEDGTPAVKILDFGLVKQLEGELREDITQEGTFLGSPRYMAPEQVSAVPVDHRCDLYALGVILYQCLVGKTPFDGKGAMEVLVQHINSPVPWMREKNPNVDVSPSLESIVRTLLEKRPEARFADAETVVAALRDVAASFRGEVTVASRSQSGAFTHRTGAVQPAPVAAAPTEPSGTIAGATLSVSGAVAPQPAKRPSATVPLAAGLFAVILAGGVVATGALRRGADSATPTARSVDTSAGPSQPSRTSPTRGVLHIESTPAGASVRESNMVLGVTPLDVALDPSGPSRSFEVVQQGFSTFRYTQQPTSERVSVVAALSAVAAEPAVEAHANTAARRPTTPSRRPTGPAVRPAGPVAPQGGGDEIRLTR
jgi:hypothetical protein